MKFILSIWFMSLGLIAFSQTEYPLETVLQKGHTDYIRAYDFTADNQFIITGSFDNILILWDLKSGKQVRTFTGYTSRIRSIEISPDQQFVLSVAADNTAKIFKISTGELIHNWRLEFENFYSGYYSADGQYVYVLDNRDQVFVWNAKSGEKVGTYGKDFAAHSERAIIYPGLPLILSAGNYKETFVIQMEQNDTLFTLPFDKVHSQSFSPDGKYIVVSSRKLFTQVFNAETGLLQHELRASDYACDGCNTKHAISPNSKYVVTGSSRNDLTLWDLKTGKKVRQFKGLEESPDQLKFSPKGTYILVTYDEDVMVFDTKTGSRTLTLKSDYIDYLQLKFTPDEKIIALPNAKGGIELWSPSSGRKTGLIAGYLNEDRNSGMDLNYNNWIDQSILQYIQNKRKVLISPDNKYALIGSVDTTAVLLDLSNGKEVQHFVGHKKAVYAFDFSPDGKHIATAGGDRKINIWNIKTGELTKQLSGHQETVFDLKYSADGAHILSGSWDGTWRTWECETGNYDYVQFKNNSPYCVGFSPNELYVITADLDKNFQFWERDAKEPFRTLIGHTSIPSSFDFSPEGTEMVTASWDGHVKVWNVLTGMLVGKLNEHQGHVYTAKYDPLGRFIASGGASNTIILWNPATNKIIKKLTGHATAVTSLDFTSDGKKLVSMSTDGVLNVWDLTTFELIYSRVQLSRTEWLATNPNGYFDGSAKALGWVNYVRGMQVVNVSNLFDKYYTPGLIEQMSQGKSFDDRGSLQKADMDLPVISLALGGTGKRNIPAANDSIYNLQTKLMPLTVEIGAHETPLDEIRIYNNGKLIIRESMEETITFRGGKNNTRLFELPLGNGINEIKVVAVNIKRTESVPAVINVNFNGEKAKTDLYIVSIGINNYQNANYNLDYAVNDSKSFVKTIKKGADSLFNRVITYNIQNSDATKAGISEIMQQVEAEIGVEDVFLFYYAGHGVMSETANQQDRKFYIVTHNVTNLYGGAEELQAKAISANELMEYSIKIKAEKQLFVLDACHSGGALEAFNSRGSEREKALAQLARNTGTFFLTASQDAQYANEVGKLNHGLFTYALLEILEGTINAGNGDRQVTVNELKSYVENRVPELTEEYHGTPQYPTGYSFGRDFPIVIVK